jgi:hypothetical protein
LASDSSFAIPGLALVQPLGAKRLGRRRKSVGGLRA